MGEGEAGLRRRFGTHKWPKRGRWKPLMECHSTSERSTVSFRSEMRKGGMVEEKKEKKNVSNGLNIQSGWNRE